MALLSLDMAMETAVMVDESCMMIKTQIVSILQSQMCQFHSDSHLALLPSDPASGQHGSSPNEDEEENTLVKITLQALQMLHLFCHRLTFGNRWVIHAHSHKQCQQELTH